MIEQMVKNNSSLEEKFAKICLDYGTDSANVLMNFMEMVVKNGKIPSSNIQSNKTLSTLKKLSNILDESEIKSIDESIKDGIKIKNLNL